MDGIPEAARQRIRDFETLIAQHSRTVEEHHAGGSDRIDSTRHLRMLKTALELMCRQFGTPPQPASRDPGWPFSA